MTRDQMIEWLVDNDLDYISSGACGDWLHQILVNGLDGYAKQTDSELRQEILERDETAFDGETDYA